MDANMRFIVVMFMGAMQCLPVQPQPIDGEKGLIFTARNTMGTSAALWHLPMMPAYEDLPETVTTVTFNDPYLQFYSLDVDYRKKIAYIYEKHYRGLLAVANYSADMDNITSANLFHLGVSSGTVQIAVDWLSHTIYWTDSTYRWIAAAPGAIDLMKNDIYKIIADTNLYYPDGIALDPLEGFLFWTDNGLHPKIERSDMAGRDRKTLITNGLISPISMETDIKHKRIYWIDTHTENIESSKYDGSDRVTLARITLSTLFDIAIFRDVLAVTDIYNDRIMFLNTSNGEKAASSIYITNYMTYNIATYFIENQPWRADDQDPCLTLNCTHMCITTTTGAECACAEGFIYNQSTKSCDENSKMYHRAMVLANDTSICLVDIRVAADTVYDCFTIFDFGTTSYQNNTLPPTASRSKIAYVDVNMEKRVLYIADSSGHIFRRPLDLPKENNALDLLTTVTGEITGLAYDWTDNNLYWSQSDGAIFVINVDDSSTRRVLANTGNIRNLVVMPHVRRLGFIIGGTIKSVVMDGTNLTTVFESSPNTSISALVVDYDEHMFYWVSTNSTGTFMFKMTIYGNESRTILNSNIDLGTSLLAVYKGYIKWMYPNLTNSSQIYYKSVSKLSPTTATHGYFNLRAVAMKMLDSSIQNIETDKCAYLNGGCEQICITYHTDENTFEKKCECSTGYTTVNTSCSAKTLSSVDFALVYDTTYNKVMQIDLRTNEQAVIPLNDVPYVYGLFYDIDTKQIIWSERENSIVYSANLNGTGVKEVGKTGNSVARRFSKDETTGNIYYTSIDDSFDHHVGVITPFGDAITLVDNFGLETIGSIAIHPEIGKMYCSVSAYPNSYIAEANMDGSDVRKFITDVDTPDGLAIDYINNFIYWGDLYENTIRRCNLNGTNCMTILNETSSDTVIIRDIVVEGDLIYYTDYSKEAVVAYNMTDKTSQSYGTDLGRLSDLWVYKSNTVNKQPENKACQSNNGRGDCSAVCLPKGSTDRTCKCNTGENLQEDGRTCSNIFKCESFIRHPDATVVTISSTCTKRLNEMCAIQCPSGYIIKNANLSMVTCLIDGWDRQAEILCVNPASTCTIRSDSIANGDIRPRCMFTVGGSCEYGCHEGYSQITSMVTCGNDGLWYPRPACRATIICMTNANAIPNGSFYTNCVNPVTGSTCGFSCQPGFTQLMGTVTCVNDSSWFPAHPCQEIKCPPMIDNGFILQDKCSFKVGIVCEYFCGGVSTYEKNKSISKLTCLATGAWNQTTGLCVEIPGDTGSQVASAGGFARTQIEMGVGIAVALVVVIAGAVLLFIFIKRRRSTEVPYSNATFNTGNETIAIENPGYMTTSGARMNSHDIGTTQTDHVIFDPLPTVPVKKDDDGFVNPLYVANAQPGADRSQQAMNGEPLYTSSQFVLNNNKPT